MTIYHDDINKLYHKNNCLHDRKQKCENNQKVQVILTHEAKYNRKNTMLHAVQLINRY